MISFGDKRLLDRNNQSDGRHGRLPIMFLHSKKPELKHLVLKPCL
jgi:hypothetical protein